MTTIAKNPIKTLSILHLALLAGPLLAATIFYLNTEIQMNGSSGDDIFIYVFPIIALGGVFASTFLFKIMLNNLKNTEDLQKKLAGYQTASLIKWALLEGPALLNIVWFATTGNLLFLTIAGVLLLFLFMQRPTKLKMENELELKGELKREFDKLN